MAGRLLEIMEKVNAGQLSGSSVRANTDSLSAHRRRQRQMTLVFNRVYFSFYAFSHAWQTYTIKKEQKKKKRGRQFHIFVFVCVCVCIHVCVCVCVKERVEWCGTESATPFSFLSRKRYGEFIFSFLSFFPVCVCVCVTSLSCFFFSFSPFFTRAACAFWRGSARRCRAAGLRRSIPRL